MKSNIRQAIFTIILTIILVSCTSAPTQIATAEFTKTVESTPTPRAKPTFTSTITPSKPPSPTTTPEIKTYILSEVISPDGLWTATVSDTTFTKPEGEEVKLTVVSSDGKRSWVVDSIYFDHYVNLAYEMPAKGES